ncbi:hypothetical protein DFS33DRAFT_1271332 [Desarmillaria ectypa]|nr:hypothetical protein DFS33DRAFT_1271332 [Desarmillaria ectypa]
MSTPEAPLFVPRELPNAMDFHGKAFSIAFHRPEGNSQLSLSVEEGVEYIHKFSASGELTRLLRDHGAVIGLAGKRLTKAPEVFSANEGPRTRRFYQHNEVEKPIANSLEIYERAKKELPEFVEEFTKRGLTMRQVYPPAGNNRGNGNYFDRTQEHCFGQKILPEDDEPTQRRQVEERARRLTPRFKWLDDGSLEVIQDVPAFRRINPGGIPIWFNGLAGQHRSAVDQKSNRTSLHRDGRVALTLISDLDTAMEHQSLKNGWTVEITRELEYVHTWEAGDLIFVHNHSATHRRAPWVLVSMWNALHGMLSEY